MLTTKNNQKGFTIVELLIVIVVIGILAALVINTFSGVQKRARDSERQTDIKSLASQLEAYYNGDGNGFYPQFSQIDTDADITARFPGADPKIIHAPNQAGVSLIGTGAAANKDQYGYVAVGAATPCAVDNACTSFTLTWYSEKNPGVQTITSLN